MGSTITCGKHAAAFSADGTTTYVLFEKTYESNVRPHRPHWSCRYFGDLRGALKRVFSDASVCEGGMLAAPGGKQILPEVKLSCLPEVSRDRPSLPKRRQRWLFTVPELPRDGPGLPEFPIPW